MNYKIEQAISAYHNHAKAYVETQKRLFMAETMEKNLSENAVSDEDWDRHDASVQELFNATIADIETSNLLIVTRDVLGHLVALGVAGELNSP